MMKRYLLFAGDCYYPEGGWDDFKGDFDLLEDAVVASKEWDNKDTWYHIYDTVENKIIADG